MYVQANDKKRGREFEIVIFLDLFYDSGIVTNFNHYPMNGIKPMLMLPVRSGCEYCDSVQPPSVHTNDFTLKYVTQTLELKRKYFYCKLMCVLDIHVVRIIEVLV